MAYIPANWADGDLITADKLNHLEQRGAYKTALAIGDSWSAADTGETGKTTTEYGIGYQTLLNLGVPAQGITVQAIGGTGFIAGSKTFRAQFDEVKAAHADVDLVLVIGGLNDVWLDEADSAKLSDEVKALVDDIAEACPHADIIVVPCQMPPATKLSSAATNAALSQIINGLVESDQPRMTWLPGAWALFADLPDTELNGDTHLNVAGYAHAGRRLANAIANHRITPPFLSVAPVVGDVLTGAVSWPSTPFIMSIDGTVHIRIELGITKEITADAANDRVLLTLPTWAQRAITHRTDLPNGVSWNGEKLVLSKGKSIPQWTTLIYTATKPLGFLF